MEWSFASSLDLIDMASDWPHRYPRLRLSFAVWVFLLPTAQLIVVALLLALPSLRHHCYFCHDSEAEVPDLLAVVEPHLPAKVV